MSKYVRLQWICCEESYTIDLYECSNKINKLIWVGGFFFVVLKEKKPIRMVNLPGIYYLINESIWVGVS